MGGRKGISRVRGGVPRGEEGLAGGKRGVAVELEKLLSKSNFRSFGPLNGSK
jgi:hypothetical protein